MNEAIRKAFSQIVGTARARSIDTEERVRDYAAQFLGGRKDDHELIQSAIEHLSEEEKTELWERMIVRDILEQSNWKIYELRFLMRMFNVDSMMIYASRKNAYPTATPDIEDVPNIEE